MRSYTGVFAVTFLGSVCYEAEEGIQPVAADMKVSRASEFRYESPCSGKEAVLLGLAGEAGISAWLLAGETQHWSAILANVFCGLLGLVGAGRLAVSASSRCLQRRSGAREQVEPKPYPSLDGISSQTDDDPAVLAWRQHQEVLQEEVNVVDSCLATMLQRREALQGLYATTSAELHTARQFTPELGRRVRTQQADLTQQARQVEHLLSECGEVGKLLNENEAWQREAGNEAMRECRRARSLQVDFAACRQKVQAQQEQAQELQHVREEMLTLRWKIDAERQGWSQLEASLRQLSPKALQLSGILKDLEGPYGASVVTTSQGLASCAAAGTPSVLRRALEFEAPSRVCAMAKLPAKVADGGSGLDEVCY